MHIHLESICYQLEPTHVVPEKPLKPVCVRAFFILLLTVLKLSFVTIAVTKFRYRLPSF